MGLTDISRFLPNNQYDAAMNAASPSAANPFATVADVTANNELSEVLANGNTTGGNNIQITTGDAILFDTGESITSNLLASGLFGVQYSGTFTVAEDLSNYMQLAATSGTLTLAYGGQLGTLNFAGLSTARAWTLPDATGTIALTTDSLPTSSNLQTVLSNGNTTGANDISINSGQNLIMGDGFSSPASKVYWSANHYINYDEYVDDILLINSTSGIEMRTSAHSASWTGATGMLFSGFGTASYLLPGATTVQRTWTLPDATGTVALTTDSLATSSNLETVLTNGNSTGSQDLIFSDGRYAKFSDGGSFYVNVKGPATVSASDKTVLFKDEAGTVALISDITGLGSGITQTYSTATSTHSARTYSTLTDSTGGTADTTVAAVSGSGDDATINNNFADILAQLANLAADQQNTAQVLNQVIDNIQAA